MGNNVCSFLSLSALILPRYIPPDLISYRIMHEHESPCKAVCATDNVNHTPVRGTERDRSKAPSGACRPPLKDILTALEQRGVAPVVELNTDDRYLVFTEWDIACKVLPTDIFYTQKERRHQLRHLLLRKGGGISI